MFPNKIGPTVAFTTWFPFVRQETSLFVSFAGSSTIIARDLLVIKVNNVNYISLKAAQPPPFMTAIFLNYD